MEMKRGFREVAHTADWELEAWAPDLSGMLEQAARGMYALAGMRLQAGPVQNRTLTIQGSDPENLLVKFLAELLYLNEQEGLAFENFNLQINGDTLTAEMQGCPVAAQDKEIKAVTYHKLAIQHTAQGLAVNLVFDV